ncbi:cupin domain-containing protein [Micromonospora sp. 4G55]|uniref:cupin domain-containing protein n=1 Tax=Micromonospora sp. 4G55 TaxID=2806102 RepID=UPI001A517A83|nr:cupin domain-containing protein [Micromonospora sp. 4G55]MBM0257506.1 cupin domain-containing protein [Micromonospora sp. 4G55]
MIVQTLFQIPVGSESGRHSHPGEEVGYLIQGDVAMEFDEPRHSSKSRQLSIEHAPLLFRSNERR